MASTSTKAPPSSPSDDESPTINISTKTKPLDQKQKKPLENDNHNAAASGTSNKDDKREMIDKHLLLLDSSLKEYMDDLDGKIKEVRKKFEELQALGSSERDFDKVRKAITKLKIPIRSHHSADSKPQHPNKWPNINGVRVEMMQFFYKEPKVAPAGDLEGRRKAFHMLPGPLRCCLLCFFKFPPEAFTKRTTMIYLWISQGYISRHLLDNGDEYLQRRGYFPAEEEVGKSIFDELIEKDFLERCYLEPNSCRMSLSDRSSLYKIAEDNGFTSSHEAYDLDSVYECLAGNECPAGNSCLINIGEAIINNEPKIFENVRYMRSLYLGRWQRSAEHHIELGDINIFRGMKKLKSLTFLSLRGISLITELPTFIFELNALKILDLRACHNLEVIPNNISLFTSLTHLDMSECYFLEHMPESLAQLSNLQVLKGFVIGDFKKNKQSCTLHDLSKLQKLRKLNIYTSVEEFPTMSDLEALQKFKGLLKLTISWGGCSLQVESQTKFEEDKPHREQTRRKLHEKTDVTAASMHLSSQAEGQQTFHLRLHKLDLQGFPMKSLPRWLCPTNLKELKKLYIRGGNLCDQGQLWECQAEHWNVEILRLKYLSELEIDWNKLRILFPKLIYLQQIKCPKLRNFQGDHKSGLWMDKEVIDDRLRQRKISRSRGIRLDSFGVRLSSLLGYGPN